MALIANEVPVTDYLERKIAERIVADNYVFYNKNGEPNWDSSISLLISGISNTEQVPSAFFDSVSFNLQDGPVYAKLTDVKDEYELQHRYYEIQLVD